MRKRLPVINLITALIFCVSVAGCSTSLNSAFQKGYGVAKYAKKTNIDLLETDVISADEGQRIHDKTLLAERSLDAAWELKEVNADSAKTAVKKVNGSLEVLIKYLTGLMQGGNNND